MGKKEASYTIGGIVNCGEQFGCKLVENNMEATLKIELLHDPSILLLGKYLEKALIQRETCIWVFTAALVTTAKTWRQPECPWQGNKQYVYMYTAADIKKQERVPVQQRGWSIKLREVNQTDRDKQHMMPLVWNLILQKKTILFYEAETDLQTVKTNLELPKGKCGEEG